MSHYHVYGIGNALVDMEYEVDPDTLVTLGIDKGVMTLVNEEHQTRIMQHLADHHAGKGAGGSAANSVVALSQLGGKGFYSCRVAGDPLGQFYIEDMQRAGVETNRHPEEIIGNTGKCLVLVTPDADRTMATYLGVTGELSQQELVPHAIRDSQYLYLEGYMVTADTGRATCIKAREIAEDAGVKTAFTLSDPNMVKFFKSGLLDMIGNGVDLLFANEAEAFGMTEAENVNDAIDGLKKLAKSFVITRGPQGALICQDGKLIEVPGTPAEAVDTLGAGDMFAGAYLYGITHHWEPEKAGALASAAAAEIVGRYGPRLPAEDLRTVMKAQL